MAYAIGRRVGGAVDRNRLRRRLRAIVAEVGPELVPGDYLVSAGPAAHALGHEELKAMVWMAMRRSVGTPGAPSLAARPPGPAPR